MQKTTILFLAANPKQTADLRLDEELRELDEGLKRSQQRDQFQLEQKWAVKPIDLRRAVLELKPQIVHFAGTGAGDRGLVLEDGEQINPTALAALFKLFQEQVKCVVLNACYSEPQAQAIAQHIPYVIGMKQAIGLQAARDFAVGFYDALGAGRDFPFAFEFGRISISLEGIPEELTPVLLKRSTEAASPQPNQSLSDLKTVEEALKPDLVLEQPEGQVSLESIFYVDRPPIELDCYAHIQRPGALIRIKAPRQMGKSSLLLRVLQRATEAGGRSVSLNFQAADGAMLARLDQFLQWFCRIVTQRLKLPDRLEQYWQGRLGSKDKCTRYFEDYLLPQMPEGLVLGLDEVDTLFQHQQVAADFFGLLRFWHEEAKNEPLWQRLRLIVVHSQEVYVPLNINQSPFNVGLPIDLPELTLAQMADLVQRHRLDWTAEQQQELMRMVGGHPYLARVALYEIARERLTLAAFLDGAPTEGGLYGEHLRRHGLNLQADLAAAMRQVVLAREPVKIDSTAAFKLRSMGLVKFQGNAVLPLCDLYRLYFRDRLEDSR